GCTPNKSILKFAAIDIGSNAIRLQITKVIEFDGHITFKKLEYVRFPLRLGQDVFTKGKIGEEKYEKFLKLMQAYKNLIDLYEITGYYGCATSAMREAKNGKKLVADVKEKYDLDIEIISGREEALMINQVIGFYLDDRTFIHIDVGGGSTELNVYHNKKKVKSQSFKLGSVRRLQNFDKPEIWDDIRNWIRKHVHESYGKVTAIGTGGNINKIFELSGADKKAKEISIDTVNEVIDFLKTMTVDERMFKLQLNPDRADVIVPASEIYIEVMRSAKADTILVPDVGLKDGIMYTLFQKHYEGKGEIRFKN
ncbi:MAG: phosphatase, partial [Cyclobacteriaceae bacterium]